MIGDPKTDWSVLSKNEARQWLRGEPLPENFRERLKNFVELSVCTNCGGVEDMSMVLRDFEADYSPCPFCVEP